MADLGKKFTCFQCSAKFYDFGKPEAVCPKCGANQKAAPAKPKAVKKEKSVHVIEDDFTPEPEAESLEETFSESGVAIERGRVGTDAARAAAGRLVGRSVHPHHLGVIQIRLILGRKLLAAIRPVKQ